MHSGWSREDNGPYKDVASCSLASHRHEILVTSRHMAFLDIFRKKGSLAGEVTISGLPPHKAYSVSLTFFQVSSEHSPPPFQGDPPTDKRTDTESVKEAEEPDDKALRFRIQRTSGFYYLGVGVIAYLERSGKMFAQVERFFPMARPCEIRTGDNQQLNLHVTWPDIPFDELNTYGTIHPNK